MQHACLGDPRNYGPIQRSTSRSFVRTTLLERFVGVTACSIFFAPGNKLNSRPAKPKNTPASTSPLVPKVFFSAGREKYYST
jgi:hypothetical protein